MGDEIQIRVGRRAQTTGELNRTERGMKRHQAKSVACGSKFRFLPCQGEDWKGK